MHGHAGPAGGQVDVLPLPLDLIGAQNLLGGGGQQVLEQVHHVVEIGVGLVELDGGELRVVLGVHALVAEDAADLIDPVHAAHDEPLQGQLGGDAHIHVDVQGVVVGDEGPGGGPAGDGVQHRRLHLHKAPAVHKVPDVLDELGAYHKVALYLRVDDQVHIPLAVAQLGAGQAVELLRQGQQGLAEQGDIHHPDGHLPPLGAEDHAVDPHDVADVVLFKAVILLRVHLVLPGVELDAAGFVLQIAEGHLAHPPLGHQPPGDRHLFALQGVEVLFDARGVAVRHVPGDGEGVVSALLELLQLVPADLQQLRQIFLFGRAGLVVLIGHVGSLLSVKMPSPSRGRGSLPLYL